MLYMQDDSVVGVESAFGHNLVGARSARRLTQAQLAERLAAAGLSLDASAISRIEKGGRSVRLGEAVAIAEALDVNLLSLVGEAATPGEALLVARRRASGAEVALEQPLREYMTAHLGLMASISRNPYLLENGANWPEAPRSIPELLPWYAGRNDERLRVVLEGEGHKGRAPVYYSNERERELALWLVNSYAESLLRHLTAKGADDGTAADAD